MIQNNPGVDDGKGKNATALPEDHPTSYQQTSGANDGSFDEPPIPPEGSAAGVYTVKMKHSWIRPAIRLKNYLARRKRIKNLPRPSVILV